MPRARKIIGPGGRPRRRRFRKTPFSEWLEGCGMSPGEVAEQLGIAPSTVYNLRNRYHTPGRKLAVAIEDLSDGAVPVDSWK